MKAIVIFILPPQLSSDDATLHRKSRMRSIDSENAGHLIPGAP